MTLFAAEAVRPAAMPLAFAAVIGAMGVFFLLPRPRGRQVALGTFLVLAGFGILASTIASSFGTLSLSHVESLLFWLFSTTAVLFSTVLITQRNPARGAIAFAFVIVSVCGLFLLLAASFLMAATIVVYAGAIIVTFLFVLMLSHAAGPSNENDRSREPLIGSLAGFAFLGLILFGLQQAAGPESKLPLAPLTESEKESLRRFVQKMDEMPKDGKSSADIVRATDHIRLDLELVLTNIDSRFNFSEATETIPQDAMARRVHRLRDANKQLENSIAQPGADAGALLLNVKNETRLLLGSAELPARNVSSIGLLLYSEYLLAVEMAGTLLLVAAIGAVAIAGRKGASA